MTTINNLPAYASNYEYMVVRLIDGEYWFYGAYSNGRRAESVAFEIGGEVIHNR